MKSRRLKRDFFNRPTLSVVRELLGKYLVRQVGRKKITDMIIEVEAYCGSKDLASHAAKGKTVRTEVMFGPAGHAYVYLIYGVYHCFNIVTEEDGYPAAVLIRATKTVTGPGRLCRHFKIDRDLNKIDLTASKKLWVEDRGVKISKNQIKKTKRIGVEYAKEYRDKLWRFVLNKNPVGVPY